MDQILKAFVFQRPHGKNDRLTKEEVDEKTREEILSLIAHHTTAVNYIYRNTKFDGRVEHRNIRFEVSERGSRNEGLESGVDPFVVPYFPGATH